jgi:hypothetical protein
MAVRPDARGGEGHRSHAVPAERHASHTLASPPVSPRFAMVEQVADAVLYEGYLLYPYRSSSVKNRGPRWQFGVLSPPATVPAQALDDTSVAGAIESWFQQTQCLLEAPSDGRIDVRLRFLQLQHKQVQQRVADETFETVPQLVIAGRLHIGFDEAVPCQFDVGGEIDQLLAAEQTTTVTVDGAEQTEPLPDANGVVGGRIIRQRWSLHAVVRLQLQRVDAPFPLLRLRVRVENAKTDVPAGMARSEALRHSLIATHTIIAVNRGKFVSLLDPPEWAQVAARTCVNAHTFPVLAGEPGAHDLVLSSPIIMYDHPQVAPESPGDLFDATEIDEILSLRTLTLSDDEKREARATDRLAAALLDRVDAMPPQLLAKLHGAVRSLRTLRRDSHGEEHARAGADASNAPAAPWWDPGSDASVHPETDSLMIDGGEVTRGSIVRLRPRRRGTDAHDMFLTGKTARVEAIFFDVDESVHVAVTIDDDPAAELHQWYGRFHYFRPDEIELVDNATHYLP